MKYLIALLLFASCYTQKKAEKEVNKAIQRHPEVAAKLTRERFPCIEKTSDTVVSYVDSVIFVECPPADTVLMLEELPGEVVTKIKTQTKTVKVPVMVQGKVITIEKKVLDSAAIFFHQAEAEKANRQLEKWKNKAEKRGKWILWLIILCALLLVGNIIQLKR